MTQKQSFQHTAQLSRERGQPSSSKSLINIRLHEPTFGEDEIAAVVEVMRSGKVTSGEKVREFESKFGPNAVMVNSGSSANLLAISGLVSTGRLRPGDEVIVSALSWSTTVWPLIQHGLIPKIVDIDPDTLNIDLDKAEMAIGKKTTGIMPVHVYGNPCNLPALSRLQKLRILTVIEDGCEALGANGVGSVGDVATYSLYFSHHITTGEGGMVVTKDPDLAEEMRVLRCHGWIRDMKDGSKYKEAYPDIDPKFLFVNVGYNLRCTEMQGAMGLSQLPKLMGFVEARRHAASRLLDGFSRYEWLITQNCSQESSWFGFPVIVKNDAPFDANEIRTFFEGNGIETRSIICGNIARQPGLKRYPHVVVGDLKNADHVMKQGFSIPCHQNMRVEDCYHIINVLDNFMQSRGYD